MQFIDTHIHLQDDKSNNTTEIIAQAINGGINKMICVSARQSDWEKVAALAKQCPDSIIPAFAVHPWYISESSEDWKNRLAELLESTPQALIGECGLDGLKPDLEKQKQVFAMHLKLAQRYCRPLILHMVKAVPYWDEFASLLPEKFVVHGFSGKGEFLQKIVKAGGYVGIGRGLLQSAKASEMLGLIPQNRLLLESDAPFQAPNSFVLQTYLSRIAEFLAQPETVLAKRVYQNAEEFIKC